LSEPPEPGPELSRSYAAAVGVAMAVGAYVAAGAGVPTLFVRRGLRPGGVAPQATLTRFTWTLAGERPAG